VDALPALSQPGKKLPSVRQDQLAS